MRIVQATGEAVALASGGLLGRLRGCVFSTPWGWDDSNDGPGRGALASDPAGLVNDYFHIPEGLSTA